MKRWMMVLGASLVTMGGARCAPVVTSGADEGSPSGTSTSSSSSTSTSTSTSSAGGGSIPVGGGPTTAIAMLLGDVPNGPPGTPPADFSQDTLSQYGSDPSSLVLLFSNGPQACDNPGIGTPCPSTEMWQAGFVVPPDLVRVGPVDLGNPRIGVFSWQFIGFDGQCGGGGGGGYGPGATGTLEIVSADASSLDVKLSGGVLGAPGGGTIDGVPVNPVVIDGSYVAMRCDAPPPPAPPNAAVVIRGSSLPAGLPSNPTIGDTPDPTALYVFLGSGTQTCADPLSPLGCNGDGRLTLRIPAALQQPGTIDLSDPQLAASVEIAGNDGEGSGCSSSVGTFNTGTLTITSADANGIAFSLYQSLVVSSPGPWLDADGLYQATICP